MKKNEIDPRYKPVMKLVEDYCMEHEDPNHVDKYARFFNEGYDAFGLKDEEIHSLRNQILADYQFSLEELAELGWHLISTGKHEYGLVAIMLLKKFRPGLNHAVFTWVRRWFDEGVENWAQADLLCSKITPVFLELSVASLEDFAPWRSSDSKWTRRAVPVTLLYLLNTVEPTVLLDFIEPMMDDDAKVVQQGLGWFLRDLWKVHHLPVEDFLHKHKNHSPSLIIQYATEKMHADKKQRFYKDKTDKPKPQGRSKNHIKTDPIKKVTKDTTSVRKKMESHTPRPKSLKPNKVKQ